MKPSQEKKLDALTLLVEKLAMREVAPIAPVLPVAPIAPIVPIMPINSGDHDAITKLVVTVSVIESKVDALQNTMDGRLDTLAREMEIIKLWKSNLIGKLSIIAIIISIIGPLVVLLIGKHFGL